MSVPKLGRYVKRNAADYILIALAVLLLLSIGARFVMSEIIKRSDRACTAKITFVVQGIEKENAAYLATLSSPFTFTDSGEPLGNVQLIEQKPTEVKVEQNDGSFLNLSSDTHVDLYFSFVAEGASAKDGTFLFRRARRLAPLDHLLLSCGDGRYEAEFLRVQIL